MNKLTFDGCGLNLNGKRLATMPAIDDLFANFVLQEIVKRYNAAEPALKLDLKKPMRHKRTKQDVEFKGETEQKMLKFSGFVHLTSDEANDLFENYEPAKLDLKKPIRHKRTKQEVEFKGETEQKMLKFHWQDAGPGVEHLTSEEANDWFENYEPLPRIIEEQKKVWRQAEWRVEPSQTETLALTDWYPPEIKPCYEGVYEVKCQFFCNGYCYWDGSRWQYWHSDPEKAHEYRESKLSGGKQDWQWRGTKNEAKSQIWFGPVNTPIKPGYYKVRDTKKYDNGLSYKLYWDGAYWLSLDPSACGSRVVNQKLQWQA